ncbi:MAG: hypothetical protein ACOZJZ_24370 [Pseudomonadota bacterium]
MNLPLTLALAFTGVLGPAQARDIYSWQDEQGRLHIAGRAHDQISRLAPCTTGKPRCPTCS